MARRVAPIVVLAFSVLAAGCLNFGEETVTYRYDEATDTLRLFLDYHGIFGDDGPPDALTPWELEQLDSVITTERSFFFSNWIWELSREELKRDLERNSEWPMEERTPLATATAKLEQQLLDALHVENGPVYFDSRHRLSAVQQVTLTHVTALIAAANETIAEACREEAAKPDVPASKRESYRRALDERRTFIVRRGNTFVVRWPAELDQQDNAKLRNGGVGVAFANDETTFQIGSPYDFATEITLPVSTKDYIPNAVDSVKSRVTVLDAFDASKAARIFLSGAGAPDEKADERARGYRPIAAATSAAIPLAPGFLRRSIEREANQLAPASARRLKQLYSSGVDHTRTGPSAGKITAIILTIAALTTGTISLAYGHSDACQRNNPTNADTCQQYRYVGLSSTLTATALLPIVLKMK